MCEGGPLDPVIPVVKLFEGRTSHGDGLGSSLSTMASSRSEAPFEEKLPKETPVLELELEKPVVGCVGKLVPMLDCGELCPRPNGVGESPSG